MLIFLLLAFVAPAAGALISRIIFGPDDNADIMARQAADRKRRQEERDALNATHEYLRSKGHSPY